jgi:lipopolysaccharide/colanic/teichoic acid biosynthesis glycosyltransferase
VAALLLLILSPLMVALALAVKLSSPGSVIFRQTRLGRGERPFVLLKFRTMVDGGNDLEHRALSVSELQGRIASPDPTTGLFRLQHDKRITRVGQFIRRLSLDELPQLLNVLAGDMSLVGPRPALPWEVELFTPEQRRRHEVQPGITGLWQVSGRNKLSPPEMLALDLSYIRRHSLALDLLILARTPWATIVQRHTR